MCWYVYAFCHGRRAHNRDFDLRDRALPVLGYGTQKRGAAKWGRFTLITPLFVLHKDIQFDMVRVGIGLYGLHPSKLHHSRIDLQSVMSV